MKSSLIIQALLSLACSSCFLGHFSFTSGKRKRHWIARAMESLVILTSEDSSYTTEHIGGSSSASESSSVNNQTSRRLKLNEFLSVSGRPTANQPKKSWEKLSAHTKNVRISKAKDAVVASSEVISPGNPASLWETLKRTQAVEKALCTTTSTSADQK